MLKLTVRKCGWFFSDSNILDGLHFVQSVLQGVLHWVAEPSAGINPLKVEVRLFDKLFLSEVVYLLFFEASFIFFVVFLFFVIWRGLKYYEIWLIIVNDTRILLNSMIGLVIWTPILKLWSQMRMLFLHLDMLQSETDFSLKGLVGPEPCSC